MVLGTGPVTSWKEGVQGTAGRRFSPEALVLCYVFQHESCGRLARASEVSRVLGASVFVFTLALDLLLGTLHFLYETGDLAPKVGMYLSMAIASSTILFLFVTNLAPNSSQLNDYFSLA